MFYQSLMNVKSNGSLVESTDGVGFRLNLLNGIGAVVQAVDLLHRALANRYSNQAKQFL